MLDDERQAFDEIADPMCHDIAAAIRGKANYLAALGLLEYSEILGGWKRRRLGERGQGKTNFDEFFSALKLANPLYAAFEQELSTRLCRLEPRDRNVYSAARSGLAHRYFMQAKSSVLDNPEDPEGALEYQPPCGLYFQDDILTMNTNQYFQDFNLVVARYRSDEST